ncbi:MAG: DUF2334 domain-containing protein [Gemmatimonadaceae bacterium]
MTLLVSTHDVAPPFEPHVRLLWSLCFARGVRPALLVVPRWHGAWHLPQHPRFANWIYARADEGARMFLHGDRHDEVGSLGVARDWQHAVRRPEREGEFRALSYEMARERIARGSRMLQSCGLMPTGVVPPACLAREETRDAARDEGLSFSEDQRFVWRLADGTPISAPTVRWSGWTPVHALVSTRVSEARWRMQRTARFQRLALHPSDVANSATREALIRALGRWFETRESVCYSTLSRYVREQSRDT